MSSFVDNDLTNDGVALLAEVQLGASFEPTKIVMGSGFLPDGTTSRTVTDVIKPEATLAISKWEKSADGNIVIGGVYSNQEITEPFYYRELGLYAKATREDGSEVPECLYSYGNAGDTADLMEAYTSGMPVERVIDVVTYIGNDAEVNLTVESGVYIPMTQKGEAGGVATLDNAGKVPKEQIPTESAMTISLLAGGWNGESAPYTQNVKVSWVTPTNDVLYAPRMEELTVKDLDILTESKIYATYQGDGYLTFTAYGEKPKTDVKFNVKPLF